MEDQKKHFEIDVVELALKILKEWKTLAKILTVSAVLGLIVALSSPREYTAEVVLAPELSSGGLGMADNLADSASSFGVDLGKKSSMDAIYPELYPDVFSSNDFILELFNVPVRLKEDDKPRTYLNHLLYDLKVPFWKYPGIWISELIKKPEMPGKGKNAKDPYRLSRADFGYCEGIAKSIGCLIDKKTSEISITVTDQDPMVAAIMADTLQLRLQNYITEYRTKKARTDFEYYKRMAEEGKAKYMKAQHAYASFVDANSDLLLESYKLKAEELENEMQLQFNAYNQMVTQMKIAEAKVQERTPAFTVIQNAYMPYKPSSRRSLKLYLFIFLGFVFGSAWILYGRNMFARYKKKS
jgi:hypothetical protein